MLFLNGMIFSMAVAGRGKPRPGHAGTGGFCLKDWKGNLRNDRFRYGYILLQGSFIHGSGRGNSGLKRN